MVLEQTITIVNNSGKIIKTGKQLYSIFKEAQGNYKDKKNEIKAERTLSRSQTFDQSRAIPEPPRQSNDPYQYYYEYDRPPRAAQRYEASEHGSQRSRRSRSVHSHRQDTRDFDTRSRHALTEANMKTLSEVSGATPSRPPPLPRAYTNAYPDDYAQRIPMDLAMTNPHRAMSVRDPGVMVPRSMSATELVQRKPKKEIDMDLAYGSIPPDLEYRTDLDPKDSDEREATGLIHRVEGLLDEAKCVHHSATATINHLQKDPDAAAAVALSLAELSSLVKKTSPAFLTLMKTASPAVFHLLASPHFLIGSSLAVGVTVVCFGGWKIVKRIKEQQVAREALAYENVPMDRPAPMRTQTEYNTGMDEALIIDDDLSSIETWRRGIVPFGEDESADMELITPMADRVTKEMYEKDDFDTKSRRSTRTSKTHDSHRSHRSHRSERSERSERSHRSRDERDRDRDSDRRSRRTESIAGSERSSRTYRSKRSEKSEMKTIEDGRSRRGDDDVQVVLRPKSHRQSSNMLKALFKPKKERDLVLA